MHSINIALLLHISYDALASFVLYLALFLEGGQFACVSLDGAISIVQAACIYDTCTPGHAMEMAHAMLHLEKG